MGEYDWYSRSKLIGSLKLEEWFKKSDPPGLRPNLDLPDPDLTHIGTGLDSGWVPVGPGPYRPDQFSNLNQTKNQKCGKSYNFRYDDEQDELSSPGFAGRNTSYENNVDCEWIIQTGPKLTFKFQMVVFELESGPPDCEFDYLSFETKDPGTFSPDF